MDAAPVKIIELGDEHPDAWGYTVATQAGEFTGSTADRDQAILQAEEVARVYGHDGVKVEP